MKEKMFGVIRYAVEALMNGLQLVVAPRPDGFGVAVPVAALRHRGRAPVLRRPAVKDGLGR